MTIQECRVLISEQGVSLMTVIVCSAERRQNKVARYLLATTRLVLNGKVHLVYNLLINGFKLVINLTSASPS
jgi:hypothetical protein